jgi:hypothetical protein
MSTCGMRRACQVNMVRDAVNGVWYIDENENENDGGGDGDADGEDSGNDLVDDRDRARVPGRDGVERRMVRCGGLTLMVRLSRDEARR